VAARDFWRRHENLYFAITNKKVIFGVVIFLSIMALSIVGPMITPYDYEEFAGPGYQRPSKTHWFGTTIMGRDVFTQVVYGLRSTLLVGFLAGTIASAIGLVVGFVSGFFSGRAPDEGLMMLTNMFMVLPSLALC
jgi:peptide/nickel transport system permease protein